MNHEDHEVMNIAIAQMSNIFHQIKCAHDWFEAERLRRPNNLAPREIVRGPV